MPRPAAFFLPLLLACCTPAPPSAPISAAGTDTVFTPVNLPAGLSRAEFSLFLPASVSDAAPARGVLCVSAYATGHLHEDDRWRMLAAQYRLAILRHRVEKLPDAGVTNVAPDADGLAGIQAALRHYALAARRPELTEAPYLFVGLSKSAAAACFYADLAPSRTLAVVAYHPSTGRQFPQLCEGLGAKVPQLHVVSAADKVLPPRVQLDYARACRAAGGLVTLFIEADVPHHQTGDPAFALAWTRAILDRRLPPRVYPNRPTPLPLLAEDDGHLGTGSLTEAFVPREVATAPFADFRGDRAAATWLPDAATATLWQTLSRRPSHRDASNFGSSSATRESHAP